MTFPIRTSLLLIVGLTAVSVAVSAQKKDTFAPKAAAAGLPERIWQDPGDMASLDMVHGPGGKARAPDPTETFTFVREDPGGSSPKLEVVAEDGVVWKVKLGPESQSETAATRFLWAAGYFVETGHYIAGLKVLGLPVLRRGQEFVSAGGIVRGARLERKSAPSEKLGSWDWFDNPFVGGQELNGLRVMMSLLNNWDLKEVNNTIYLVDGGRYYTVTDLGATFGNTGNALTRSKGMPAEYEDSKFIAKDTPDFMDFVLHSRPFFLGVVGVSHYRDRTRMEQITRHIPRADARWLGQRLSKLTDGQIRAVFRAAGYGPGDVEILSRTIRLRIAALESL
jgi:hypothetical protein